MGQLVLRPLSVRGLKAPAADPLRLAGVRAALAAEVPQALQLSSGAMPDITVPLPPAPADNNCRNAQFKG
jgi:hypothetical protein